MLVLVFLAAEEVRMSTTAIRTKLELLGLSPVSRRDLFNVLVNPFVEKFDCVLSYGRHEVSMKDGSPKGMSQLDIEDLVQDVAVRCLDIACKVRSLSIYSHFFHFDSLTGEAHEKAQ